MINKNIKRTFVILFNILVVCTYYPQEDNILQKNTFFITGFNLNMMVRSHNNPIKIDENYIIEHRDFDTLLTLKNTINPAVNFFFNKFIKKYLVAFGISIQKESYGYFNVYDYEHTELKRTSAGCIRIGFINGIGYRFDLRKSYIVPKINIIGNFLVLWNNKYAGYVKYYEGYSSVTQPFLYVNAEILYR